jgi:hypothetical protein
VLTIIILLIASWIRETSNRFAAFKKLLIGALLIVLALRATPAVLKCRNAVYKIPDTHAYHSHGIWHSLYLGLGWNANPWGILWDDRYGIEVARRINPQATYGTVEYLNIMRELYWRLVTREPVAVLKIYWKKALQTWNFPLQIMGMRISRWFLLMIGLAAVLSRNAVGPARRPLKMIFALGLLYLVFSSQGVLAIPTGTHLYPLKFCVLLMMAVWADYGWILISPWGTRDGPPSGDRTSAP